jgi:hypothetical protein
MAPPGRSGAMLCASREVGGPGWGRGWSCNEAIRRDARRSDMGIADGIEVRDLLYGLLVRAGTPMAS